MYSEQSALCKHPGQPVTSSHGQQTSSSIAAFNKLPNNARARCATPTPAKSIAVYEAPFAIINYMSLLTWNPCLYKIPQVQRHMQDNLPPGCRSKRSKRGERAVLGFIQPHSQPTSLQLQVMYNGKIFTSAWFAACKLACQWPPCYKPNRNKIHMQLHKIVATETNLF